MALRCISHITTLYRCIFGSDPVASVAPIALVKESRKRSTHLSGALYVQKKAELSMKKRCSARYRDPLCSSGRGGDPPLGKNLLGMRTRVALVIATKKYNFLMVDQVTSSLII